MPQVLLAEDNAAIGLALEDALSDGGYTVVGPFFSCSAALAWLRDATPDLGVVGSQAPRWPLCRARPDPPAARRADPGAER